MESGRKGSRDAGAFERACCTAKCRSTATPASPTSIFFKPSTPGANWRRPSRRAVLVRGTATPARQRAVEILEDGGAAHEALLVVLGAVADTGDEGPDALRFRAPELVVLEVDVVHDL